MPGNDRLPPNRQNKFVDRDREIEQFLAMLEGKESPCILLLHGDSGMGKSWLIDVLYHECSLRGICAARINFDPNMDYDLLQTCRSIRDQLGAEAFKPFTDKLNWCTTPGYELALRWQITELPETSQGDWLANPVYAGDAAEVTVRDRFDMFVRPHLPYPKVSSGLTTQLIADLRRRAERSRGLVLFFDDLDKSDPETCEWLWRSLLTRLGSESPDGPRLVAVVSAEQEPPGDYQWQPITRRLKVENLSRQDVDDFARMHAIDPLWFVTLWVLSKEGCPHLLAQSLPLVNEIEKQAASENLWIRRRSLQKQLQIHKDNLNHLEERAAAYGVLRVPLDLRNEIGAEKAEIARLEAELARLGDPQ
jgi:hypothetical protein